MKIDRLELIERVQEMIQARQEQAEARHVEAIEKNDRAEAGYVEAHGQDWAEFATNIRRQVRNGRAVTLNEVPKGLRSGSGTYATVDVFRPGTVKESDYVPRVSHLTRLLAVLESSPDQYVSTSALDRMGAPLRELMRP